MQLPNWIKALVVALCSALAQPGLAQVPRPTVLEIDTENAVLYYEDATDLSKLASNPNITTTSPPLNFGAYVNLGDIVAVNGQPAKGTVLFNIRTVTLRPAPNPGDAIADTQRTGVINQTFEILDMGGTPIGTIIATGLAAGPAPPGAPPQVAQGNNAIVGGTGAFLGVRGYTGQAAASVPARRASMTEDPANRRQNGGGKVRFVLHVIPMLQPEIATTASGPAVFHADFSPVTTDKPAKAGEVLILQATGLGPTVPSVNPGQPFPPDTSHAVNSPLQLSVSGRSAPVINKIGWPGLVDTYRVDFRIPDGAAAGLAAIQLAAAWIAGPSVSIPIQ
jgi:uncharacterized protein (TIGR03437 family)